MTHITIQREREIRHLWPYVAHGINQIADKGPERLGWDHRDVLGQLLHNPDCTFLYMVEVDGDVAGFMVARIIKEEFTFQRIFHIWLLYLEPWTKVLDEVARFADDAAKQHQCRLIRMWSSRPGWDRLVERFGGERWMTIYQKEI